MATCTANLGRCPCHADLHPVKTHFFSGVIPNHTKILLEIVSANLELSFATRFSSVKSLDRLGRRRDLDVSAEIIFQSLLHEAVVSSSGIGRDVHSLALFHVVYPALPVPSTASPTLHCAPKNGKGGAAMACDMPELCEFPSLDICQESFLWAHKLSLGTQLLFSCPN